MNEQNLLKLADFIWHNVTQEVFDMWYYRPGGIKLDANGKPIGSECGTVGCALGWAPFVPGLEILLEKEVLLGSTTDHVLFSKYSYRVFGLDGGSNEWNFLFASDWRELDNTPIGFVRRVYALIDGLDTSDSFFDGAAMNCNKCEALKEKYDREYAHIN